MRSAGADGADQDARLGMLGDFVEFLWQANERGGCSGNGMWFRARDRT